MAQVQIRDFGGNPIPLMNIRLGRNGQSSNQAEFDQFTDLAGNTAWPLPPPTENEYDLFINYANIQPRFDKVQIHIKDFNNDIVIKVPFNVRPVHVEGLDFVTDERNRHVVIGTSELMLAWAYDTIGENVVKTVLSNRCGLGFNNLRVLWQKDIRNTGNSPWQMPSEKMPSFLRLCADYGFHVEGTILADCGVINSNVTTQQRRVNDVRMATIGIMNNWEQLGNEYEKNNFNPNNFSKPTNRLSANASSTEGGSDAKPYWDYFCFSGGREPAQKAIREYGPIEFMYGNVNTWGGVPAICDEGMKPGKNSATIRDFERAGAQARSGCGGRFHTVTGTGYDIVPFNNLEWLCAVAFVKGLQG